MAWGGAVRPELVVGTVGVIVRQGLPVLVVVLGYPPRVGPSVTVDQAGRDGGGPGVPYGVAGNVSRGEVRLHRVHVAVDAAVRLKLGEVGVPALQRAAFGVGPEVLVDGGRGGRQGGIGTGNSGGYRAGGGQQDLGMSVVRFRRVIAAPGRVRAGNPAAVLVVGVAAHEGRESGCRQGIRVGHAGQGGQCEHIG